MAKSTKKKSGLARKKLGRPTKITRLSDWIASVGTQRAADICGVSYVTAMHWRNGTKYPRPARAQRIVKKTTVTYEGIYGY